MNIEFNDEEIFYNSGNYVFVYVVFRINLVVYSSFYLRSKSSM